MDEVEQKKEGSRTLGALDWCQTIQIFQVSIDHSATGQNKEKNENKNFDR